MFCTRLAACGHWGESKSNDHGILSISSREQSEQRGALIRDFEDRTRTELEAEHGDTFRQAVIDEFESRGETATEEDIEAGVDARVDALLAEAVDEYTEGALSADLERALLPLLRLSMPPEHYAALQQRGILHLLELEVITMRSGLRYYRDHPDGAPADNLLNRPRYRDTPEGLELLDGP